MIKQLLTGINCAEQMHFWELLLIFTWQIDFEGNRMSYLFFSRFAINLL